MIIPSHIPNVPKWVIYPAGRIIAWLNPVNDKYCYQHVDTLETLNWASCKDVTDHMKSYNEIRPLTSLGELIQDLLKGYRYSPDTIRMYVKDLLKEIHKEKQNVG